MWNDLSIKKKNILLINSFPDKKENLPDTDSCALYHSLLEEILSPSVLEF